MPGQGRPFVLFAVILSAGLFCDVIEGKDRFLRFSPQRKSPYVTPTPLQDDANLRDIQFVGRNVGYAVGDRGVIWKTENSGRTWKLMKSPVDCSLRRLCFLTDRVGWIVGGGIRPFTRIGYGVVLFTNDGGRRWEVLSQRKPAKLTGKSASKANNRRFRRRLAATPEPISLPPLVHVRFFSLTLGIAVGESSEDYPSGVMVTKDGGKSWTAVPGRSSPGWRAAAFLNPAVGAVAGLHGRISVVGGGRLLKPAVDDLGLRGVRAMALNRDETGWIVGDGALLRKTENGGVVWKSPPKSLPKRLGDVADFHAVATQGKNVWIAGSPGSFVWHSADAGKTWTRQSTGQTVPIHGMRFVTDRVGWAVGALGTMLATGDGGRTWIPIRGKERRLAILSVNSRKRNVSFSLLAKMSADQGYRTAVLLPSRGDFGPDGPSDFTLDYRAESAVSAAGANAAVLGWRFPVALPGLDRNPKRLWADWNLRSEGRLREVMLGSLESQIRTWRPTVLVLDTAVEKDAMTKLLNQAVVAAVKQAGDEKSSLRQPELVGLKPWRVKRIYVRQADGSSGHATVSPHEYLAHRGFVNHIVATAAESRLQPPRKQTAKPESYRLVVDLSKQRRTATRGFFTGLTLWPGSDARRKLDPINEADLERETKLAKRQRNFQAIAERTLDDPQFAGQMIAKLTHITAGMKDERASLQLMKLADDYRKRSLWELAEATWIEQVTRYPDTAAALSGMQNLFYLWAGAETTWHRAKKVAVQRSRLSGDRSGLQKRLAKAVRLARIPPVFRDVSRLDLGPDPVQYLKQSEDLPRDRNPERQAKGMRHWQNQALQLAALIRKRDPELYVKPRIQFPLAALLRSRGALRASQMSYGRFQRQHSRSPWKTAADSEAWLLAPRSAPPRPLVTCQSTGKRPRLDGVLSDACWENAKAIWLTPTKESGSELREKSFVMFAYDAGYLYIAGNVPNEISPRGQNAKTTKRVRDADLTLFDRIGIRLDVDRDYATWYSLDIDQRGWTHDECWGDQSWDPKWHVASDRDKKSWRFEAAIPWKELAPRRPGRGTTWGVGLVRIVPAVGVQSWTHPVGRTPRPETFGLLRFQ